MLHRLQGPPRHELLVQRHRPRRDADAPATDGPQVRGDRWQCGLQRGSHSVCDFTLPPFALCSTLPAPPPTAPPNDATTPTSQHKPGGCLAALHAAAASARASRRATRRARPRPSAVVSPHATARWSYSTPPPHTGAKMHSRKCVKQQQNLQQATGPPHPRPHLTRHTLTHIDTH